MVVARGSDGGLIAKNKEGRVSSLHLAPNGTAKPCATRMQEDHALWGAESYYSLCTIKIRGFFDAGK